MKSMGIQVRIVLWAGLCLLGTSALIVALSTWNMRQEVKRASEEAEGAATVKGNELAENFAAQLGAELESALDTARILAQTQSGIKNPKMKLKLDRDSLNGLLRTVCEENPQFVGIGTCWEPDALDELDSSAVEMNTQSANAAATVQKAASSIASMAEAATQASGNTNAVAAAIKEMSASLSEVASNCANGAQMSSEADGKARSAGETMAALHNASETVKSGAGQINIGSGELEKMAEQLRGLVGQFKTKS